MTGMRPLPNCRDCDTRMEKIDGTSAFKSAKAVYWCPRCGTVLKRVFPKLGGRRPPNDEWRRTQPIRQEAQS